MRYFYNCDECGCHFSSYLMGKLKEQKCPRCGCEDLWMEDLLAGDYDDEAKELDEIWEDIAREKGRLKEQG